MKSKAFTYMLIAGVLVVWGLIIYRIYLTVGANDDDAPVTYSAIKKEVFNDYEIPKDTTRLLLNYRDPFGMIKVKDTAEIRINKLIHRQNVKPNTVAPAMNWNFIRYAGYIRNMGSKKLVAIVNINGKNNMLAEGEYADGVKLLKNLKDSIKISFNGKTKFIVLKPAS